MKLLRRIASLIIWLVGIVAALLGIAGAFSPQFAVAAGVLTAVVVTVQYMTQGNTTVHFGASDWRNSGGSCEFSVGRRRHGKGPRPNVGVYMRSSNGGYEEVECDVRTLESGEVLIGAATPFEGEVRIS